MATTFNMLRANDLIWSFVVNNYLLGKEPCPFDLLFWNSDTTRMPEKMHLFYLRECYRTTLWRTGKMVLGDVKLDLSKVKMPVYLQSAKEDHVAPFRSVFKATKLFKGPIRFIMAGIGPYRGGDQRTGGEEVPVLDQRQDPRDRRRVAGKAPRNIPAPGGRIGTSGCPSFRERRSRRANLAMESFRRSAMHPDPT